MDAALRIALVHLVRRQNPPEAFARFWKSYIDHDSGMDHDVIIIWKNFIGVEHPNVTGKFKVHNVVVSDRGRDIDMYIKASKMFDHDAFVFLNSWSEIKRDGWLKTMHDAMRDEVGLVGAFSSLESHRTNIIHKIRRIWNQSPLREKVQLPVYACYMWLRLGIHAPPRPNFHVRTNGFLIRREIMAQIRRPVIFDKIAAYRFESGYHSLTRQVLDMGYKIACLDEYKLMTDNQVDSFKTGLHES
jgi:hypothetical protein